MTKWIRLQDQLPPKGELVLGFDVFYNLMHLCVYDGETITDEGEPLIHATRPAGDLYDLDEGGDYFIGFWMPLPHPPNVEERG